MLFMLNMENGNLHDFVNTDKTNQPSWTKLTLKDHASLGDLSALTVSIIPNFDMSIDYRQWLILEWLTT